MSVVIYFNYQLAERALRGCKSSVPGSIPSRTWFTRDLGYCFSLELAERAIA
jgi:hypothetical protein